MCTTEPVGSEARARAEKARRLGRRCRESDSGSDYRVNARPAVGRLRGETAMKFMLMMNTPGGGPYQIASWPEQDIKNHIAFMREFSKRLADAGELAGAEGLA